jgi:hypothetical protein
MIAYCPSIDKEVKIFTIDTDASHFWHRKRVEKKHCFISISSLEVMIFRSIGCNPIVFGKLE